MGAEWAGLAEGTPGELVWGTGRRLVDRLGSWSAGFCGSHCRGKSGEGVGPSLAFGACSALWQV